MTTVEESDLKSISSFQPELHIPVNYDDEILSDFHREKIKTTWYTHSLIQTTPSTNKEQSTAIFDIKDMPHRLMYCYMRQKFNAIVVKPGYKDSVRIKWCKNPAVNRIIEAKIKANGKQFGRFDSVSHDFYLQYYRKNGGKDEIDRTIGPEKSQTWSDFLPAFVTNVFLPWGYAEDQTLSFPLHLFYDSNNKSSMTITQEFTLRNNLDSLLRMQVRNKLGKWINIKYNSDYILMLMDNGKLIDNNFDLKMPEVWSRQVYQTKDNLAYERDGCDNDKFKTVYYYNDIISIDSDNAESYEKNSAVPISCDTPCRAIFFAAENILAKDYNIYSNYTTNMFEQEKGCNPIDYFVIKYETADRTTQLNTDQCDMEAYYHMPNMPYEIGYNVYSLNWNHNSVAPDVGQVYKGRSVRMLFKLRNSEKSQLPPTLNVQKLYQKEKNDGDISELEDASSSINEEEIEKPADPDQFIVHVRLLVQRRLEFKQNPDGIYTLQID
jgi:hypothetical protein